jgi:hypothetical protein
MYTCLRHNYAAVMRTAAHKNTFPKERKLVDCVARTAHSQHNNSHMPDCVLLLRRCLPAAIHDVNVRDSTRNEKGSGSVKSPPAFAATRTAKAAHAKLSQSQRTGPPRRRSQLRGHHLHPRT